MTFWNSRGQLEIQVEFLVEEFVSLFRVPQNYPSY